MKKLTIGILAHVDAGKTTLSEALLYRTGTVRRLGRVDHQDAFLDTDEIERERGITIFSKCAVFPLGDREATLLDTPGHVDFSAEMERTLGVLDCAILVISGTDGVQSHTRTLWRLLAHHRVPTFLFINKMDLPGADRPALLGQLREQLSDGCADFSAGQEAIAEAAASTEEDLLERYLAGGTIADSEVADLVAGRRLFPCYFGAALKLEGVDDLLDGLSRFALSPEYPEAFAARVFKIARDGSDRLTFLKITGGALRVREALQGADWQEKVSSIRIYSGRKYRAAELAEAGTVCAVTGLSRTKPGDVFGTEPGGGEILLEPVLTYRVLPSAGGDEHILLQALRQIEEEEPQLRVVWNEALREIHVQLMGEVQLEILQRLLAERFGMDVTFDEGSIVYKETIAEPAMGIGHFEPLRHYAEVHLLIEPLPQGSGLRFAASCPTDELDLNWQRLILTHLQEKTHLGVLTGSALTDVRITLIAGRAHIKHTEGGDFRQATYRAVRQGLRQARSVLLEPYCDFRLEVPQENVGRAMADIQAMGGAFSPPELSEGMAVLTGSVSVAAIRGYWTTLAAYTKGQGRLSCTLRGYAPCHNAEEVIVSIGYDCDADVENTADSVFCSHGAGVVVKWDQVPHHAHIPPLPLPGSRAERRQMTYGAAVRSASEKELEEIFVRTYGPVRNRGMEALRQRSRAPVKVPEPKLSYVQRDDVLLVDGYNMIFAWDELRELSRDSVDAARSALTNALANYQGLKGCQVILVFDAYRVKGNAGTTERHGGIEVVYTKEGETADMYIERISYDLGRTHRVKVATSDGLEQVLIQGHGAQRLSARDLKWEVDQANRQLQEFLRDQ